MKQKHHIILAPEAVEDLNNLRAYERARVRDALETLRNDPTRVSKSRIKRLRGLEQPQYRLRVDEIRVFYDVIEPSHEAAKHKDPGKKYLQVNVLAIIHKQEAQAWLDREGIKKS